MPTTTNLGMVLPPPGGSSDTWGDLLNAALGVVDAFAGNIGPSILSGLTLSTAGSSATFACASGAAGATTGVFMALASSISKTTSGWAVGSGNGSLDTGSIANSTWYHVYLIQRSDTGIVDILISLSASAPTMPTNYDRKRRIGAMKTNGSAQWVAFSQIGDEFIWSANTGSSVDINMAPTTTQSAQVLNVPLGVKVKARIRGFFQGPDSTLTAFNMSSPSEAGLTSASTSAGMTVLIRAGVGMANDQSFTVDILTDTSAQVNVVADSNSASNLCRATAYGWIDPRGKW